MYIITENLCQNCKLLKQLLGEKALTVETKLASENMDLCRQLGVKSVPALVKDDNTIVFGLEEIIEEIERGQK